MLVKRENRKNLCCSWKEMPVPLLHLSYSSRNFGLRQSCVLTLPCLSGSGAGVLRRFISKTLAFSARLQIATDEDHQYGSVSRLVSVMSRRSTNKRTHAAVLAKTSGRLAFVKIPTLAANRTVKTATNASLTPLFLTSYKATMAPGALSAGETHNALACARRWYESTTKGGLGI